jgi:hypothetical protein
MYVMVVVSPGSAAPMHRRRCSCLSHAGSRSRGLPFISLVSRVKDRFQRGVASSFEAHQGGILCVREI